MQILYTILFTLMMLIDWTRGSQAGSVWAITVNCVGILFGIIIFTVLPRPTKNMKHYHVMWWLLSISVAVIYFIPWHQGRGYLIWLHYLSVVLNIALLGSLFLESWSLHLWKNAKSLRKYQKWGALLWVAMMLYMCISPLKSVWPIWFLCLFGIYYIIPISQTRKQQLFQGILNGMIIGFFAIQIWAYGFRPYDVVRYTGAYMNANMNALMYLMTYIALLVKIYQSLYNSENGRIPRLSFYTVLLAGMWGFMLMTGCRTAIYIAMLLTCCFGIAAFIRNFQNGVSYGTNILRNIVVAIMFPVLTSVVFVVCYATVRYLPCVLHHPVWLEMEYAEWKVHSFDPWNSYKYINFDELLDEIKNRMPSLVEYNETKKEILSAHSGPVLTDTKVEASTDKYESMGMRKEIYWEYLQNLNWHGHKLEEGHFQISENWHAYHAQNLWIQMAFYYGIPAGVLLLLLTALTGIRCLVGILSNISDDWRFFSALVWVAFFGFGMMECVWYPGQFILFLIFFTQKNCSSFNQEV